MPDKCPICNRPAHKPFRIRDGKHAIVEGCVDAYHDGHLALNSADLFFHNRPESKKIRRDNLKPAKKNGY